MQKARHDKTHRRALGSWLSTARSAMQAARSRGRLFPPADGQYPDPGERIVENFQEALEQVFSTDDGHKSPARPDLSEASKATTRNSNAAVTSGRVRRDRVVFFAPGPITEADLLRENLKIAAAIRHRHRRRRRFAWLTDNAGTIAVVTVLFVLAWFITAR